jgi:hypothetical protein
MLEKFYVASVIINTFGIQQFVKSTFIRLLILFSEGLRFSFLLTTCIRPSMGRYQVNRLYP